MLVALLVRLASWQQVFTADGLRFLDNDSYYHAFRVRAALTTFPHIAGFDGGMDYPLGAQIIWPPLFDFVGAALCRLAMYAGVSPEQALFLLPFLPVVYGVLLIPLMVALARTLLPSPPLIEVAWLTALLPAAAHFGMLGRYDQHVAELLLFTAALLLFTRAAQQEHRGMIPLIDVLCGGLLALAFWNWQGSVLNLAVVTLLALAHYVTARPGSAATRGLLVLTRACAVAAALLVGSILLFAPGGTLGKTSLVGLSGFPPLAAATVALFAAGLLFWQRAKPAPSPLSAGNRVILWGVLSLGLALLLSADLLSVLRHGFAMISAGNAWYQNIQEFDPLLFAGFDPLGKELSDVLQLFGFSWLFLGAAVPGLLAAWQAPRREETTILLVLLVLFLPLGLLRARFILYLLVPLILGAALGWQRLAGLLDRRWGVAARRPGMAPALLALLLFLPTLFWYGTTATAQPEPGRESLLGALAWLRQQETVEGREGVMAEWDYGHLIRYAAARPVVVTPFGTDLGPEGMKDSAAFFLGSDPDSAEKILHRRRIGFILLSNPLTEACFARSFAPPGTPPAVEMRKSWQSGARTTILDRFWQTVPSRLYFNDGLTADATPAEAVSFCRLVYETSPLSGAPDFPPAADFKLFEVVPGARFQGRGTPGSSVTASCPVTTNGGRSFTWQTTLTVPASGSFTLRLPYATGANRLVMAGPYRLDGSAALPSRLSVSEQAVRGGKSIGVGNAAPLH
jgi:dolichyl-diphosphooligosaccharide--protein glycosyltransferase